MAVPLVLGGLGNGLGRSRARLQRGGLRLPVDTVRARSGHGLGPSPGRPPPALRRLVGLRRPRLPALLRHLLLNGRLHTLLGHRLLRYALLLLAGLGHPLLRILPLRHALLLERLEVLLLAGQTLLPLLLRIALLRIPLLLALVPLLAGEALSALVLLLRIPLLAAPVLRLPLLELLHRLLPVLLRRLLPATRVTLLRVALLLRLLRVALLRLALLAGTVLLALRNLLGMLLPLAVLLAGDRLLATVPRLPGVPRLGALGAVAPTQIGH
ncbi:MULTISPECIES: hypothetical protein [unclassified Kitasatospora]|uniref:hypothetical protein n=1 Tax=unclassified Kitasatospora TaxID=2633591 RepID=UPI00381511A9